MATTPAININCNAEAAMNALATAETRLAETKTLVVNRAPRPRPLHPAILAAVIGMTADERYRGISRRPPSRVYPSIYDGYTPPKFVPKQSKPVERPQMTNEQRIAFNMIKRKGWQPPRQVEASSDGDGDY